MDLPPPPVHFIIAFPSSHFVSDNPMRPDTNSALRIPARARQSRPAAAITDRDAPHHRQNTLLRPHQVILAPQTLSGQLYDEVRSPSSRRDGDIWKCVRCYRPGFPICFASSRGRHGRQCLHKYHLMVNRRPAPLGHVGKCHASCEPAERPS
jgi:hypothetical protein